MTWSLRPQPARLAALALIACIADPGLAATRRVPADHPTIQAAIDASANGDAVLVSPGTYFERIDFKGKAVLLSSAQGPEVTIIDGQSGGTTVTFATGEGAMSVLEGFTIRGGSASFGAGLTMLVASPTIVGNIFEDNAQGAGGFGAAIGGNVASPIIERNLFRRNSCDGQWLSGVVSFVNGSSPWIVNNVFVDNPCRAIQMTIPVGYAPRVINNTMRRNAVGIRVDRRIATGLHVYRNNLIAGNGIGLEVDFGTDADNPTWRNNLLYGNGVNYSGIAVQTGSNGNISANPLLSNVAGREATLMAGSAAIDAGDATGLLLPEQDYEGDARIGDGDGNGTATVDIGADEYTAAPTDEDLDFDRFEATLRLSWNGAGKFRFWSGGLLAPAPKGDGIDPTVDTVVLELSDGQGVFFAHTIPAGKFRKIRAGLYRYRGTSGGLESAILRETREPGVYSFELSGAAANLGATDAPLRGVRLRIGNDRGFASLPCQNLPNEAACR